MLEWKYSQLIVSPISTTQARPNFEMILTALKNKGTASVHSEDNQGVYEIVALIRLISIP